MTVGGEFKRGIKGVRLIEMSKVVTWQREWNLLHWLNHILRSR